MVSVLPTHRVDDVSQAVGTLLEDTKVNLRKEKPHTCIKMTKKNVSATDNGSYEITYYLE